MLCRCSTNDKVLVGRAVSSSQGHSAVSSSQGRSCTEEVMSSSITNWCYQLDNLQPIKYLNGQQVGSNQYCVLLAWIGAVEVRDIGRHAPGLNSAFGAELDKPKRGESKPSQGHQLKWIARQPMSSEACQRESEACRHRDR